MIGRALKKRGRRPHLDQLTLVQQGEPVAQAAGLAKVVSDEHYRGFQSPLEPSELILQLTPGDRVEGAHILLKEVTDAERFGVAEVSGDRIIGIEEKPRKPKSNLAVTGFYMYDATVFDKIKTLVPSGRGELEITDVNNAYIREGTMTFSHLDGWWTDAGTFDSLLRAANLVAQSAASKTGLAAALAEHS